MTTKSGTPINRHWVVVLKDASKVVDWGDGLFQDILSGEFMHGTEADISHTILDNELEQMMRLNQIFEYDANFIYVHPLPELPHSTID
jgi:hypothetical protein